MSGQRTRSAVVAEQRSAHPNIPGVPWWGAVLIAVTATAIGFAFDAGSGNEELGFAFSACYVIGCVLAVLAVRQTGVFTAVVQPPLILFVAVPTAYFLFHGASFTGIKDTLINFGYPLIERFPLMIFTSAAVLLIGMVRWYVDISARPPAKTSAKTSAKTAIPGAGLLAAVTSRLSSVTTREPAEEAPKPQRRRSAERPGRATKSAGANRRRPAKRAPRSRHARPPQPDIDETRAESPRRARSRRAEPPPMPRAEPRRRPRPQRDPYERPERQPRRYDDDYGTDASSSSRGTHHPISRVRYRDVEDGDARTEHRVRARSTRGRDPESPESWRDDV